LQEGLQIASEIGHREWVVGNRFALGLLYAELFALDQARRQLESGLSLAEELQSPMWIHFTSGALAGTYMMLDNLPLAQTCLEKSILPDTPMDTLGKRYCWIRRAELALALDDRALALAITDQLITSAPSMASDRVITYLWKLKADALVAIEHVRYPDMEKATSLLQTAIGNAEANGEQFILWRLRASLGQLYQRMEDQEAAEKEFLVAKGLIEEMAATVPDKSLKDVYLQGAYGTLNLYSQL
jgi:tetratricopeptide (TPR) repeat protein